MLDGYQNVSHVTRCELDASMLTEKNMLASQQIIKIYLSRRITKCTSQVRKLVNFRKSTGFLKVY